MAWGSAGGAAPGAGGARAAGSAADLGASDVDSSSTGAEKMVRKVDGAGNARDGVKMARRKIIEGNLK